MTDNPFLCSLPNKQHEATAKDVTDWKRRDEQRRGKISRWEEEQNIHGSRCNTQETASRSVNTATTRGSRR